MSSPSSLESLVEALRCLPGIGPKSAQRMAYYLMQRDRQGAQQLADALQLALGALRHCQRCNTFTEAEVCELCQSTKRDQRLLCVVEEVADLWALERSRLFPGRFHVLGGRLSALEGVRPEDLAIDTLVGRVAAGGIDEVVLAMNATLEGQTTAHYIADRLEAYPVRLTQLAHGLPVGGELDYLDEGTLAQALRARRPVA